MATDETYITVELTKAQAGALLGFFQAHRSEFLGYVHSGDLTGVEMRVVRECDRAFHAERYPAAGAR